MSDNTTMTYRDIELAVEKLNLAHGLPDRSMFSVEEWHTALREYWACDTEGRYGLSRMAPLADQLQRAFAPVCLPEKCIIAGSVSRFRERVKDIELVVEPALTPRHSPRTLFDPAQEYEGETIEERIETLITLGTLRRSEQGSKNGERQKNFEAWSPLPVWGGEPAWVPFELWIVRPPAQFGVIQIIRHGPKEFSEWLVASRGEKGGGCPADYKFEHGVLLHRTGLAWLPVDTPTEREVFTALGLDYVEPRDRVGLWRPRL